MTVNLKKDYGINQRKPELSNLVYGKVPPQCPDVEDAVIAACMLERNCFEQVMDIIFSKECFYMDSHQKIYQAICALHANGHPIDLITVTEQLRATNELELVGGGYYLSKLTQAVLSTAHVKYHAMAVMETYFKRETIRICGQALTEAYEDSSDAFELMEALETNIKGITDGVSGEDAIQVGSTYQRMLEAIREQRDRKTDIIGISSGFDELDRLILGFIKSDLIILAARPSHGKTAFAVNFAEKAAAKDNHVLLFSLESSDMSLVRRIAAARTLIPLKDIRTGRVNDFQESLLIKSASDFNKLPIRIDPKSRKISTIVKSARRWKKKLPKGKNGMIIIDYLQLMKTGLHGGNREQEVSSMSRDLKELAMELDVPIIALSQLNREVEKTADKKPGLQHLRESGAIEQDANIIMFVWWEELEQGERQLHLLVEKNRDGECGDVKLKMNADFQKILNMEEYVTPVLPSIVSNAYQGIRQPYKDEDTPF